MVAVAVRDEYGADPGDAERVEPGEQLRRRLRRSGVDEYRCLAEAENRRVRFADVDEQDRKPVLRQRAIQRLGGDVQRALRRNGLRRRRGGERRGRIFIDERICGRARRRGGTAREQREAENQDDHAR